MILFTLSKKLNRILGPFLLRHGLRARFALGGGVVRDSPLLDAIVGLPWSMKLVSIEVHEEIEQQRQEQEQQQQQQQQQVQQTSSSSSSSRKKSTGKGDDESNDHDTTNVRLRVLERYVRPVLIPNERWSDVRPWQFHSRLLRWVRSEYLWARHGQRVSTAMRTSRSLRRSYQLLAPQEQERQLSSQAGRLESLSFDALPPASLVCDALATHDWTTKKDWSATGRSMAQTAEKIGGGRVMEIGSMVRFVDADPDADLSERSFGDVLELAGAYVSEGGPLNALCEKRNVYQVWTREYVEKLGEYLLRRTASHSGDGGTVVLDVGAGDGLLAHFLRESFEERNNDSGGGRSSKRPAKVPTIIATDDGSWGISQVARVEPLSVEEAMEKYAAARTTTPPDDDGGSGDRPQVIVLCSWMPMNEDWTRAFRQARVDEYILIGECDDGQCGENWETWGNRQYHDEANLERELKTAFSSDDDDKKTMDVDKDANSHTTTTTSRTYEADGYRRNDLDALAPYQFSRFDCRVSKAGRTVSFRIID